MRVSAFIAVASLVALVAFQPWGLFAVGQVEKSKPKGATAVEQKLSEISGKLDAVIAAKQAKPPAAKDHVSEEMKAWITAARDDIRQDLEQKEIEYEQFKAESEFAGMSTDRIDFETSRLLQIEESSRKAIEELEEAKQRVAMLTARNERLAKETEAQRAKIKRLAIHTAKDRSIREDIERTQSVFDAIIQRLADVELALRYGSE